MYKEKRKHYEGFRVAADTGKTRAQISQEARTAEANAKGRNTNAAFAAKDQNFRDLCELNDIPITTRQASKFRSQKGIAYAASQGFTIKKYKDTLVAER
ncbi:MAG: hypothetical protein ACYDHY_06520 [Acidiferrobacterales bacterium]